MNYVIGHGLYIKVIDLKTLGGFPEDTINEDACLGYLLNCNNIKIIPIPFLEKQNLQIEYQFILNSKLLGLMDRGMHSSIGNAK